MGAALAGFALSLAPLLISKQHKTPNELLDALASELRDMVDGMTRHGDEGTPAAAAMIMAATMLEASAPTDDGLTSDEFISSNAR